ncbi:MAG: FAD-binding protein [Micrococcales bacterium 73-15]|uniref:FAD-binding protein n=1 Tax=Salana multivorans TaxID=120377 RepID=UPI00095A8A31|nr:D-arabinono-1,4-lactone oxidase [Salana multivorans]OJX98257.1 MAG: FAD-binding protein [Micrococcales bacterium 73-15]
MNDADVLPSPRTWAGHRSYGGRGLVIPRTLEELRAVVTSGGPVRALGSRHSFNDLADSPGLLVSLEALASEPVLAPDGATVTVSGATRYGTLGPWLHERGAGLDALASLPHISVAGAVATGTHGSGDAIGSLASCVTAVRLMTADGNLATLRRGDADFPGAVVALGALGVVVDLDLAVRPTYDVAQTVVDDVPLAGVLADLDAVWSSATSVSAFTRWDGACALWRKHRVDAGPVRDLSGLGGRPADGPRHPIAGVDAAACTEQGGVPGPWFDRLPHFRLEFTPSAGAELQSEYLLPREVAAEAIAAAAPVLADVRDLVLVSEIRSVAADDLWLSGEQGRDTIGLHTTWRQDVPAVTAVLARLEEVLAPYDARPHWGKLFVRRDVGSLYPRWDDARELIASYDPRGVFSGPFLERVGLR